MFHLMNFMLNGVSKNKSVAPNAHNIKLSFKKSLKVICIRNKTLFYKIIWLFKLL